MEAAAGAGAGAGAPGGNDDDANRFSTKRAWGCGKDSLIAKKSKAYRERKKAKELAQKEQHEQLVAEHGRLREALALSRLERADLLYLLSEKDPQDLSLLSDLGHKDDLGEAAELPVVGDKEDLHRLALEGDSILSKKIKKLAEKYCSIRRTRADGNSFFRSFLFAYLEYLFESEDRAEVARIMEAITAKCGEAFCDLRKSGDKLPIFLEEFYHDLCTNYDLVNEHKDQLVGRFTDQSSWDSIILLRLIASSEVHYREEFFKPFVWNLTKGTVEQFCKSAQTMGEESHHVHITALSNALGVPIRVLFLDQSAFKNGGCSVNHHDFVPNSHDKWDVEPFITLLYYCGHYDILYPKIISLDLECI